jgi:hypothetical protein
VDGCGRPLINPINHNQTTFSYDGDACNRIGWFDSLSHESRDMMNCGPIRMNISDTQIVTVSYMIGYGSDNHQNICILQNNSDSALKYYYNDFKTCIPIGIQPISAEIPERFALYQNYPNPFNPSTKIRFSIPVGTHHGAFVQVNIYDIQGREITTLVNEELKPGIYEVDWNAISYSSGIYYYELTTNNFKETKKMVMVK